MFYELLIFTLFLNSAYAEDHVVEDIVCGPGTHKEDGMCVVDEKRDPVLQPVQGDCLIATASYGSELSPQVQMLREVRDNVLLSTDSGIIFMTGFNTIYYSFAGDVAQAERDNPIFKEAVKLFIAPMIATLSIMTLASEDSEEEVIFFGISAIGLILGIYVLTPILLISKIKGKISNSRT